MYADWLMILDWSSQNYSSMDSYQCLFLIYVGTIGETIVELPIQSSCVIDLATSQQGIVEILQVELMKQERPEFLAQKHSIESDLIHHQKKIKKEQVRNIEPLPVTVTVLPLVAPLTFIRILLKFYYNLPLPK